MRLVIALLCYARPMIVNHGSKESSAFVAWWAGVVITTALLLAHPHLRGPAVLATRTPFDNTGSGHAEQWAFLRAAAAHIPQGASFTVVAQDVDTEMSLFMMAVGLLPDSRPIPSSYYGEAVEAGGDARFVLEFGDFADPQPPWTVASRLPGGRLLDRRTDRE